MATLQSPGVAVTVIDESFYTPAEPGTTPLIVVATAENKRNGSGTGTALATTKAQAGKAFRVTSQRDLVDLFGVPFFEKTPSGSPIHAGERNEYGLLAAFSFLGVSNSAFIVRADVDLAQLEGSATAPGAEPKANQWWLNTASTAWGIQEWDNRARLAGGQRFYSKTPVVLTDADTNKIDGSSPAAAVGAPGDYAVLALSNDDAGIFYKNYNNQWTLVGSREWRMSHPVISSNPEVATSDSNDVVPEGSEFTINEVSIVVPPGVTVIDRIVGIRNIINTLNETTLKGVSAREFRGVLHIYIDGDLDTAAGDSSRTNSIEIRSVSGSAVEDLFDLGGTDPVRLFGPVLQISPHTQVPQFKRNDFTPAAEGSFPMPFGRPTGSVWIKSTEPNNGARWRLNRWNTGTKVWEAIEAPIYRNGEAAIFNLDRTGGGLNIPVGAAYVQFNSTEDVGFDETPKTAKFKIFRRASTGATVIISSAIANIGTTGSRSFFIKESRRGSAELSEPVQITFTVSNNTADANRLAAAINGAGLLHVRADVTDNNEVIVTHSLGGEIRFYDTSGIIGQLFSTVGNFYATPVGATADYVASNWQPLSAVTFIAKGTGPLEEPRDGQLWYNPEFSEVDLMAHNGTTWVGINNHPDYLTAEVIVAASAPELDETQIQQNNHIWVSTADLENFPIIYRWDSLAQEWNLIDITDQTTEDGVLFADARYGISGVAGDVAARITEYRRANYLDPDAPDPALYPRGMLLWNLRRSGGNVKRYANNYIDTTKDNVRFDPANSGGESMTDYATDRWVTASANQENGAGTFGRKAQHIVVVAALKSVVDTSAEIRDEERRNFNLIACPGYPELLSNLINLNIDRGITSFVVGDTPFRLASDATTLTNWGTNANGALDNNEDGIVSYDEYCAVFYPQGFTTDLSGTNAVVPASHMMLRTIALSDQVSYPWFAPAGTRRGGITNATAVGYIDSLTGEFQTVSLNEGQRDVLYDLKVNPITFFVGAGLVNYGQKTRGRNASALDRINVSRLTVYLRSQLNKLARPYVFEPNDKITRDEIKSSVESLLLELVSLRAIYDFAVVCDESNNTPSRIDRNELYVDVAIEPVKAVEFIYIPLRVKNTGEI
jgi:hypothetical protein